MSSMFENRNLRGSIKSTEYKLYKTLLYNANNERKSPEPWQSIKIILHNAHNECKSPEWQQGIRILLHNAQNEHKSPESFSDKACLHTNYFLQPSCTLNWRRANATDYRVGNNATVGGLKEGQCNRQWSRWTEGGPVQETTVGELKPGQHNKQ